MTNLDPELIQLLRQLASERRLVAAMLRTALATEISTTLTPIDVVRYFREAFGLTLAQAKPIADWFAYGGGEMADAVLQELMGPRIESTRGSWETARVN